MEAWQSRMDGIIDAHVHMGSLTDAAHVNNILEAVRLEKMGLVSIQDPAHGSGLPQSLYMKGRYPGTFYVFAGLNHGQQLSGGRVTAPSLVAQVESFRKMGCDGIKMIEGKPTSRQTLDIPVTDTYFADYWARVEDLGVPLVWHVGDPEEFWNPEQLPEWARKRGWGYSAADVQKEELYAEVDEVLARHPNLRIIFAHFYFLSADLARAARFFDAHPHIYFDLTPGIEMLYNLSRDAQTTRDFFLKYADRIVFGTDISSRNAVTEAVFRAGIIFRWLESDATFRVPDGVDVLLGKPEDGIIRGLSLPDAVLERIYRLNYTRLVGAKPRSLSLSHAIAECTRIGSIARRLSGMPAEDTEAVRVARKLEVLS